MLWDKKNQCSQGAKIGRDKYIRHNSIADNTVWYIVRNNDTSNKLKSLIIV